MKRLVFIAVLLAASIGAHFANAAPPTGRDRYVVILSVDGFRWDLSDRTNTPTLDSLRRVGTYAEMEPVFPSNTFPSHYSMATGLYPDNHGIVNNTFYSDSLGRYSMGDTSAVRNAAFYGGEPLWNTAERQGLPAEIYMWVGSEAPVGGRRPRVWTKFDASVPFDRRADMVLEALTRPVDSIPRLVMWYLDEPDHTEHLTGPDSPQTLAQASRVDSVLGRFLYGARRSPVFDRTDFLIVSDHGMSAVSPERYIDLYPLLDSSRVVYAADSSPLLIETEDDYTDEALRILSGVEHIRVWRREELPDRFRYGGNVDRISSLVVLPDAGWTAGYSPRPRLRSGGSHGYDPAERDMHMIFYGAGPDFRAGYEHPAFTNHNVYWLAARLLGIEPAPGDWEPEAVEGMIIDTDVQDDGR